MSVYLVLYLWHAMSSYVGESGQNVGGPIFIIQQMPDVATCEEVGKVAKELGDAAMPRTYAHPYVLQTHAQPRPVSYRCVVNRGRK